ncbi:hypothetical protein LY76DRAFT_223871 [Colletotrichum caudatum]|nr:hypothetical protein LY76DRAFT_223871 [Colletotrichum caudatum]
MSFDDETRIHSSQTGREAKSPVLASRHDSIAETSDEPNVALLLLLLPLPQSSQPRRRAKPTRRHAKSGEPGTASVMILASPPPLPSPPPPPPPRWRANRPPPPRALRGFNSAETSDETKRQNVRRTNAGRCRPGSMPPPSSPKPKKANSTSRPPSSRRLKKREIKNQKYQSDPRNPNRDSCSLALLLVLPLPTLSPPLSPGQTKPTCLDLGTWGMGTLYQGLPCFSGRY